MKHILEYEDIEGLYGDLKTLGVTEGEYQASLWVFFDRIKTYKFGSSKDFLFALTGPFVFISEEKSESFVLEALRGGDFESFPKDKPEEVRDLMTWSGPVAKNLKSQDIQEKAGSASDLMSFLEGLHDRMQKGLKFMYRQTSQPRCRIRVTVGPVGDPRLFKAHNASLFQPEKIKIVNI